MPVVKKPCSCRHLGQDELHGPGVRVYNVCGSDAQPKARCSVCSHEMSIEKAAKKGDKKGAADAPVEAVEAPKPKGKKGAAA